MILAITTRVMMLTDAGIIGQEDDVLKKVLPFTLISCLLLGALTQLLA